MIVVCKPCESPKFYENVFVLQQHLQKLRLCCGAVVEAGSCPQCLAGPDHWHTPLSLTNNAVSR